MTRKEWLDNFVGALYDCGFKNVDYVESYTDEDGNYVIKHRMLCHFKDDNKNKMRIFQINLKSSFDFSETVENMDGTFDPVNPLIYFDLFLLAHFVDKEDKKYSIRKMKISNYQSR